MCGSLAQPATEHPHCCTLSARNDELDPALDDREIVIAHPIGEPQIKEIGDHARTRVCIGMAAVLGDSVDETVRGQEPRIGYKTSPGQVVDRRQKTGVSQYLKRRTLTGQVHSGNERMHLHRTELRMIECGQMMLGRRHVSRHIAAAGKTSVELPRTVLSYQNVDVGRLTASGDENAPRIERDELEKPKFHIQRLGDSSDVANRRPPLQRDEFRLALVRGKLQGGCGIQFLAEPRGRVPRSDAICNLELPGELEDRRSGKCMRQRSLERPESSKEDPAEVRPDLDSRRSETKAATPHELPVEPGLEPSLPNGPVVEPPLRRPRRRSTLTASSRARVLRDGRSLALPLVRGLEHFEQPLPLQLFDEPLELVTKSVPVDIVDLA